MKNWQLYMILTAIMGLSFFSLTSQAKAVFWIDVGTASCTDYDNPQEAKTEGWVTATLNVKTNFPVCSTYLYSPSYPKGGLDASLGQYWDTEEVIMQMYHEGSGETVKHWGGILNTGSPNLEHPWNYTTTLKAYVHFSETTTNFDWWTE